jgi:hypothetical protein
MWKRHFVGSIRAVSVVTGTQANVISRDDRTWVKTFVTKIYCSMENRVCYFGPKLYTYEIVNVKHGDRS